MRRKQKRKMQLAKERLYSIYREYFSIISRYNLYHDGDTIDMIYCFYRLQCEQFIDTLLLSKYLNYENATFLHDCIFQYDEFFTEGFLRGDTLW